MRLRNRPDVRRDLLPPELQRFRPDDWASEHDPPPWDESKLKDCPGYEGPNGERLYHTWNGERRRGCVCPGSSPLMWSSTERYSELYARYWRALEGWGLRHGLDDWEAFELTDDAIAAAELWDNAREPEPPMELDPELAKLGLKVLRPKQYGRKARRP